MGFERCRGLDRRWLLVARSRSCSPLMLRAIGFQILSDNLRKVAPRLPISGFRHLFKRLWYADASAAFFGTSPVNSKSVREAALQFAPRKPVWNLHSLLHSFTFQKC